MMGPRNARRIQRAAGSATSIEQSVAVHSRNYICSMACRTMQMTPAGLEPAIPGSVGRCLIHWATGPRALCGPKGPANPAAALLRRDKCREQVAKTSLGGGASTHGSSVDSPKQVVSSSDANSYPTSGLPPGWGDCKSEKNSNGEEHSPRACQRLEATTANSCALMRNRAA